MNQKLYIFTFLFLFSCLSLAAQITVKDGDLGNGTYNWTKDNIYQLDGLVYLEDGGVLNIEAGTVIKGLGVPSTGNNTSALVITRGAQIFAEGTAQNPIIFTSDLDDTSDSGDLDATLDKGLWGGLIILGNATIARPGCEDGIEGIDANEARAKFGGAQNCGELDDENSGVLRYVSIRHGGAALSAGNEINGLSLGGVGSGTTLEYIEIISNLDDGIEFFGGTVDLKYAAVSFCGDDGFDYDFGWSGNGQYWFYLADDEGSVGRGGEHDGAKPDLEAPFSKPTIFNATYIGSGADASGLDGDENDYALNFRDRAGGFYHNSVFTDFADKAIAIEDLDNDDMDTYTNFQNGDLALRQNIWWSFGGGTDLTNLISGSPAADVASQLVSDGNILEDPRLAGIDRDPVNQLDPRPNPGPAWTAGDAPTNAAIEATTFKGAFDPNAPLWLNDWTALDEYGYLGNLVTDTKEATAAGFFFHPIVPMPVQNTAYLKLQMPKEVKATIALYNLAGQQIQTIINNETLMSGEQTISFDVHHLPAGQYFVVLHTEGYQLSHKMIVAK